MTTSAFLLFLLWFFLSVTWTISYFGFFWGWRRDYSVRTRLLLGALSIPTLLFCVHQFYLAYVSVGWLNLKNKSIEDGFYFSLISALITGTFFIGATLKKRRNPEQKILPEAGYGKILRMFILIALTGACALLPFWLYLVARQGDAVMGWETLESLVFGRPYTFWSFQVIFLLYWWLFVRWFCLLELTATAQKRVDPSRN